MTKRVKDLEGGARPFLKWAGGKTQLLDQLLARVPEHFGTYHEPFVGCGALFFRLRNEGRVKKARLSDINPELMNVWRALRDEPANVIEELEVYARGLGEEDYYQVRALDPAKLTRAQRAARLIYLNKTGFNGLYRENSKGRFNVPYGKYTNPKVLDRDNLHAVSRALKGVSLEVGSFGAILKQARAGDFVYLDPPYHPVSTTSSFTAYSKGGFGEAGQRQLATVFFELARNGVTVLLSNSDVPLIQELYEGRPGCQVARVQARRSINSKGDKRGAVSELLVFAEGKPPSRSSAGTKVKQLAIDL